MHMYIYIYKQLHINHEPMALSVPMPEMSTAAPRLWSAIIQFGDGPHTQALLTEGPHRLEARLRRYKK